MRHLVIMVLLHEVHSRRVVGRRWIDRTVSIIALHVKTLRRLRRHIGRWSLGASHGHTSFLRQRRAPHGRRGARSLGTAQNVVAQLMLVMIMLVTVTGNYGRFAFYRCRR